MFKESLNEDGDAINELEEATLENVKLKEENKNLGTDFKIQLENTFESIPTEINIGKIVEKPFILKNEFNEFNDITLGHKRGFPEAQRRNLAAVSGCSNGSIFSRQLKRFKEDVCDSNKDMPLLKENSAANGGHDNDERLLVEPTNTKTVDQSFIVVEGGKEIHKHNVDILSGMTQEEITEEREKLLATVDPAIVEFLKSKRMNYDASGIGTIEEQNKAVDTVGVENIDVWREIKMAPDADKWLNFGIFEPEKLTWTSAINVPKCEEGKSYEARFDFDGWLLPFVEEEINERNRILYHHGEEAGRPGYTLKELFQLSRSSVIQQKVISLNTIANILYLNQSGIYDGVIEIPLEQIFFVVRFCLDDNTPSVLNASIKAMRNLFYFELDETCLDNLLGFGVSNRQPIISIDDTEDNSTINDQQLAEINLVKCLVRTDIIKRIRYINNTVRPSIETIIYCLEILTRLARDSNFVIKQIFSCETLLDIIIEYFIPVHFSVGARFSYGYPLLQAIKLCRILAARNKSIAEELINRYNIMDSIVNYLTNVELSGNSNGLKIQIECLHLWCVFLHYGLSLDQFIAVETTVTRVLDFHVRQTDASPNTSYILNGHIGALLSLITEASRQNISVVSSFIPFLSRATDKWCTQLGSTESYACGKLQIASALFKCIGECLNVKEDFIGRSVRELLASTGFNVLTNDIKACSNLLCKFTTHRPGANLKSMEAAVWNSVNHVVPILNTNSCIPFLTAFTDFILRSDNRQMKISFLNHKNIVKYLNFIKDAPQYHLITNWFTRIESQLILTILKIAVTIQEQLDTGLYYQVAVKCLCIFNLEQNRDVAFLLEKIIFSTRFYPCENLLNHLKINETNLLLKEALNNLCNIFTVYTDVLNLEVMNTDNLSISSLNNNVIPVDWIYSPIVLLYSNQQENKLVTEERQIFVIKNCLRWIYIYEMYFPDLAKLINPTDRFCRLACTYLCSDTIFLNSEIRHLLENCLKQLLQHNEQNIDFNQPIKGLNNFQDFYTQLLEQYQGVSYGDVLFGNFILLPLMQRHDPKYRKTLWSEYAGIVQVFNVVAKQVLCHIEMFFNPLERDITILECYRRVLSMGAIRKHSFFYDIAKHHLEAFAASKKEERKKTLIQEK